MWRTISSITHSMFFLGMWNCSIHNSVAVKHEYYNIALSSGAVYPTSPFPNLRFEELCNCHSIYFMGLCETKTISG
jgi:hypothetical protein